MRKVNLLLVVTKLELGGAQRNALDIVSGLDRARYNVFLFTARDGLLMQEALAVPGLTVKRSRFLDRPVNPLKDLLALVELWAYILRHKIEIVHTHSSKAGILGRLAATLAGRRGVCHTVHGWSFNDRQPAPVRAACVAAERLAGLFTRRLIVVSRHDREEGVARGIGMPRAYALVPYGIRRELFRARGGRETKGSDPVIGTVACLKPQKSPQDFIRLASLVRKDFPRARFIISGDGALRQRVERMVRERGLEGNVVLAGWSRDIPAFLRSLDVFCLTSLWEGLPISVIEAMTAGVPVVCTDTGGVRDLIADGSNGYIVPRGDMEAMASAVRRLLRDRGLRDEISRRATELPPDFDVDVMVRRTEAIYRELLPIID